MAAGKPNETVTRFPKGVGQFTFVGKGAAAGDINVKGVLKSRDTLVQVTFVALSGVLLKSFDDYTGEFTIKSNDYVNNTGGTASTSMLVFVTVARASA